MANIIEAKITDIYDEDFKSGGGVSEDTLKKMGSTVQGLKYNSFALLGDIKFNDLPLTQFQALASNMYVLRDGQEITNTDYGQFLIAQGLATAPVFLPDQRGMHIVGANNGRNDGLEHHKNPVAGGFVSGDVKSHKHTVTKEIYNSDSGNGNGKHISPAIYKDTNNPSHTATFDVSNTGQPQNTVHAIGTNIYIKVWNVPQP